MLDESYVAEQIADFDEKIAELLRTIESDLLSEGFPAGVLPRLMAQARDKLSAFREVEVAKFQRSAGAQLH